MTVIKINHFADVSKEFGLAFNDKRTSDIELIINGNSIFCHKSFLQARSKLFRKQITKEMKTLEVKNDEFLFESYVEFLKYLYTGKCNITEKNWKLLLPIAAQHKNDDLKALCFSQMIKGVTVDSVCSLIKLARSGKEKYYDDIFVEKCVTLIEKKPNEVFKTKDFLEFDETTIIFILQNSKLCIEEYDLWKSLLNWARAQLTEEEKLTDNINIPLKRILTPKIIENIRFPLIEVEDLEKIYKTGLITQEKYLESLEYFILDEELPKKYSVRGSEMECMKFDKKYHGSKITLSQGNKVATFNASSWNGSALGVGGHCFTVKVLANSYNTMIGFSNRNLNKEASNYSTNGYFMYFSGTTLYSGGNVSQKHSGKSYGSVTVQVGQTVGAKYDRKKGTITFYINGKSLGTAYTGVKDKKLFPCMDFYTQGAKLQFVKGKYK